MKFTTLRFLGNQSKLAINCRKNVATDSIHIQSSATDQGFRLRPDAGRSDQSFDM